MPNKRPVSLNLPEDLLAAIDQRAAAEDRSRSQWLVRFLTSHGVNPHALKDGPYNSEVSSEGTRLVDMAERYHVVVGMAGPEEPVWWCEELPEVRGAVKRVDDVYREAKAAIEQHLGVSDVAVYVTWPSISLPR
jgi:hypothetical protein